VLVCDRDVALRPVPLGALAKARGSTFKPFPPRHGQFAFDFRGYHRPAAAEVRAAIRGGRHRHAAATDRQLRRAGHPQGGQAGAPVAREHGHGRAAGACVNAFFLSTTTVPPPTFT
jgi:hypothetical protein